MDKSTIEILAAFVVILGAPLASWIVIKVNIAEMKKDINHNDDKINARIAHVEEDVVELKTGRADDNKERKEEVAKFMQEVMKIGGWFHEMKGDIKSIKETLKNRQ